MTAPKLRMAGFKEPWSPKRLGATGRILQERTSDFARYPLYSLTIEKGVTKKTERYERGFLVSKTGDIFKIVHPGNFVTNPMNLRFGAVGYSKEKDDVSVSGYYDVFELDDNKCSPFWFNFLKREEMKKRYEDIATGSLIEKKRVHVNDLLDLELSIPELDERKSIGEYLTSIDRLIDAEVLRLESLRKLKVACLEKMFVQGGECCPRLRLEGFTGSWVKKVLGECGNTYNGLNGKTKSDFGHGNASYVPYVNVYQNAIADVNLLDRIEVDSNQNEVRKGDVLFTTSSETPDEVGLTSVWLGDASNVYLNSFCFGYRPNVEFDQWFLANVLRADDFRRQMYVLAQGISRYNISKTSVMNLSFYAPPTVEEQQAIGVAFRNLEEAMTLQVKKIDGLRHMKSACMERMFV